MRKRITIVGLVLLMAMMISVSAFAKVVLVDGTWPAMNDKQREQYVEWEEDFEAKNPDIDIQGEYDPYDKVNFMMRAEAGQLSDLFSTYFTEPQRIIRAGYAADITDIMKEYGYDEAINPSMLDLVTKDGRIYGIPYNGYYMGIWYNMNLMEEAGLVDENGIPEFADTYDELAEIAVTIKEKTGKPGFFFPTKNNQGGWQFMNIAWSYGAEFEVYEDGKWKAVFNSPEAVKALQFIKDLKWKYDVLPANLLVDAADMFRMFGTDQVGMAYGPGGGWRHRPVNDYGMSKDNLAISSTPAGPAGRYALMGGNLYMFAPSCSEEQIQAGLEWLKERGFSPDPSPDGLAGLAELLEQDKEDGRIVGPHNIEVWVNPERQQAEEEIYEKYTNVNMALFEDYMNYENVEIRPEEPLECQQLYKTLDNVIQAVLTDKNADPKALLDKAVEEFQKDFLDKFNE